MIQPSLPPAHPGPRVFKVCRLPLKVRKATHLPPLFPLPEGQSIDHARGVMRHNGGQGPQKPGKVC